MKKVYRMKNLDCANCAAKMERAINKIEGVEEATISFMTQKMSITCDESRLAAIVEEAKGCVAKVDPHCQILGA